MHRLSLFDEKVGYMREVYQYLMSQGDANVSPIVMHMLEAGYYYDNMLEYMKRFIDSIYNAATHQCFDIYETDTSKIRYSKLPKEWKNKPILKDIHVNGEFMIPTIYHVRYIIDIYKYIEDKDIKEKIDTVIKYILHPQYQKLRGDYGYGWFYNKAYYACSCGVSLPLYEDNKIEGYKDILEMMSNSPQATSTEWFQNCMNFLEQYKTEQGTYILPDSCFYNTFVRPASPSVVYQLFVSKEVLSTIKIGERRSLAIELLSTFYVELIKKRMGNKLTIPAK